MDYRIKHFESIDSTNKLMLELINSSPPEEGLVVWTDEQTDGKGHGNNLWESEKGKNLTFSLLLKPSVIDPAEQFILTQMISLAIRNLITKFVPDEAVKIKWPNDVYIAYDKVAGILIQNILKGNEIDYSVIGIGLNVNQEKFHSDAPNPVSLIHYTGASVSVEDVLSKLLIEISMIYSKLGSKNYLEKLNKVYLENLYLYKKQGNFREGKNEFKAKVEGIGEYGRLKLRLENGKIQLFDFKEVEFVL